MAKLTKPVAWTNFVAALVLVGMGLLGFVLPSAIPWHRAFLAMGVEFVFASVVHLKRAYRA